MFEATTQLKDVKFNGTVYGKEGAHYIFVDKNKVAVTDEQVKNYNVFKRYRNDLTKQLIRVMHSEDIAKHFKNIYNAKPIYCIVRETRFVATSELEFYRDNLIEEQHTGEIKGEKFTIYVYKDKNNGTIIDAFVVEEGDESRIGKKFIWHWLAKRIPSFLRADKKDVTWEEQLEKVLTLLK